MNKLIIVLLAILFISAPAQAEDEHKFTDGGAVISVPTEVASMSKPTEPTVICVDANAYLMYMLFSQPSK